ncbi:MULTISPECIES: hypothetical protein [unclassified Streptomyces]|uniref:hypothetical protein n=1 Tax=unclassified Streptomyces TaxID=2593676 RepID=UPI00278C3C32|nr:MULTISPECIES: hypothetical protein [unclassified Streptomyces]
MDAELTTLATTVATTLVQQMTTDAWTRMRDRIARVLGRGGGGEEEAVVGELDEAREQLLAAREAGDEAAADDVAAEWRSRMRRTLGRNPEQAEELRRILRELDGGGLAEPSVTYHTHNEISGGTHQFTIQAGHVGRIENGRPPQG